MNALVVGEGKIGATIAKVLQAENVAARYAQDEEAALSLLMAVRAPCVAFIVLARGHQGLLELLKKTRSVPHVYVIACGPFSDPALVECYAAGLFGDMKLPLTKELIVGRYHAWSKRFGPDAGTQTNGTALADFAASKGWANAFQSCATSVAEFLDLEMVAARSDKLPECTFGRDIILSNIDDEMEVRIGIGADESSALTLAEALFGEGDPELVDDLLAEIANVIMGVLRAEFAEEGFHFTGGLPREATGEEVVKPAEEYAHEDVFLVRARGANLVVYLAMRSRGAFIVPLEELAEGMILVKDTFNERGILLVRAQTRLSKTTIEKLQSLMAEGELVEVRGTQKLAAAAA